MLIGRVCVCVCVDYKEVFLVLRLWCVGKMGGERNNRKRFGVTDDIACRGTS